MGELVLAIVAVIGVLVGGAAVFGQFRVSKNTSAIAGYRDTALAYEAMHKAKNEEIEALRAQNGQQAVQIDALNQKLAMLQDMVTSRTLIEALAQQIDGNFAELSRKIDEMMSRIAAAGEAHG